MYHTYWGLDRPPFFTGTETPQFYEGASQREALARLRFVVDHRRRLGLLQGGSGFGKSMLLDVFSNEYRQKNYTVAQVDLLGISSREFFWQVSTGLHAAVRVDDDPIRLFRQLVDRIQENRLQGVATVLLLDNADQAGADLLTQLQRLVHLGSLEGWFTVVVAVNRAQSSQLGDRLLDRVDLRVDLQPWDELDTTGYVQHALVEAGSVRPLFDEGAIREIHHLAEGNPRRVNRLADYALLIGSNSGRETIDSATVNTAGEAIGQSCLANS